MCKKKETNKISQVYVDTYTKGSKGVLKLPSNFINLKTLVSVYSSKESFLSRIKILFSWVFSLREKKLLRLLNTLCRIYPSLR